MKYIMGGRELVVGKRTPLWVNAHACVSGGEWRTLWWRVSARAGGLTHALALALLTVVFDKP
eukprot:654009-Lingulodinium_polyedra.AAC.1